MTRAEVGLAGQQFGVVPGGDVDEPGRLLSVAEIQHALRGLRAWEPGGAAAGSHTRRCAGCLRTGPGAGPSEASRTGRGDSAARLLAGGDTAAGPAPGGGGGTAAAVAADDSGIGGLHPSWITVVAAHAGAGASTVALAISDAAAADARRTHLVDPAPPLRSGLVAAASAELGIDPTGAWRRGTRRQVTIDRRCGDVAPDGWPTPPADDGDSERIALTVIDVGLPGAASLDRLAAAHTRTVLVCRPTVPGARLADALLSSLGDRPLIVAAVGDGRWPSEVTASLGNGLRRVRSAGRVVTVPVDRRLQATGPTHCPLPRSVLAAGRRLLGLLDDVEWPSETASTGREPAATGRKR